MLKRPGGYCLGSRERGGNGLVRGCCGTYKGPNSERGLCGRDMGEEDLIIPGGMVGTVA